MEGFKAFQRLITISATLLVISAISVNGQIGTPCTISMINSFTPCLNYITGSTGNGSSSSSPTADCCSTLQTLTNTSMDCACLVITANVPFQVPINPTLAISLLQACNMNGVPVQCKSSGSPLPAPGPFLLGPTPSPLAADAPLSPRASKVAALEQAPDVETSLPLSPASPPVSSKAPTTAGIRPVLTPSASNPSYISSPLLQLIFVGIVVLKCF